MNTIRMAEWDLPRISDEDQRMIDRAYRRFFARRGIRVAEGLRDVVAGAARSGKASKERGKK